MNTLSLTTFAPSPLHDEQITKNPRLTPRRTRALRALWNGPVMREAFDRMVGCSNGPQIISELRKLGIGIDCTKVEVLDRDNNKCMSGLYALTDESRATLLTWDWEGQEK